jgi:hypothetical protein
MVAQLQFHNHVLFEPPPPPPQKKKKKKKKKDTADTIENTGRNKNGAR